MENRNAAVPAVVRCASSASDGKQEFRQDAGEDNRLEAGVTIVKMEWLSQFLEKITWSQVGLGVGLFVFSLLLSFGAIALVMIKIPADYFSPNYNQAFMSGKPFLVRWGAVILKNVFGVFLIALGIVLSLPGIPGQGLLTILLGLIMLDIPGKRPLEARIIQRPTIRDAINNLRARFQKPPLILD